MRYLISIHMILILASSTLSAQNLTPEVVANAGETFSSGTLSLEWTLGELMTESYAGTIVLTQGFHQPNLNITSVRDLSADLGTIKVYPNPTSGRMFIEKEKIGDLSLIVWDIHGRIMIQQNVSMTLSNLDLSHLPSGIYVLRLHDGKKVSRNIRIEKI